MRYFAGGTASTAQGALAPNDMRRYSGRANVDITPLPALRVALRASHLASGTTLPVGDVFSPGTLSSGMLGNTADDPVLRGYLGIDPASLASVVTKQHVARSFGSGAAEWAPLGWLTARGLIGRELVRRDDSRTFPMAVAYLDPAREGPFRIEGSTRRDKHTTVAGNVTADYAIAGTWARRVTGRDANGDGVIVPSEITEATAQVYLGSSIPTREAGLATTLGLFRGRVTLSTQADYRGGFMSLNGTEAYRCGVQLCSALYDPGASVSDQTRAVLGFGQGPGFTERGDFVRLREVALAWVLAPGWSRRNGGGELSLTVAGRNLLTATRYSGLDPEVNALGQSSFGTTEFFTLPLPRTFALRFGARW